MKLRDDIVGNACDSHTAPCSKMADINTKMHNEVIQMSKVWHIVHQNPHFQGQGMQWRYQKCPRVNALQDSHWQHAGNSSSKPGKPALSWMPVSTLGNFTGSNHEYTFSGHTAVGNSAHWLHLSTFPPVEDTLPRIEQGSSKPSKFVDECQ